MSLRWWFRSTRFADRRGHSLLTATGDTAQEWRSDRAFRRGLRRHNSKRERAPPRPSSPLAPLSRRRAPDLRLRLLRTRIVPDARRKRYRPARTSRRTPARTSIRTSEKAGAIRWISWDAWRDCIATWLVWGRGFVPSKRGAAPLPHKAN